jgi:hypothetical protein
MANEQDKPPPAVTPATVPTTNVNYGSFSTIALIEAYKIRYAVPAFIRDTFFAARDYAQADVVRIDSMLGRRGLAPFILPLEGQVVGRRQPFKETFISAPIIAPARVVTLREATRPGWGETIYNFKSPEERVAAMIANDAEDMDDEIARTEEWMCCQCMFTGTIPIKYRNKTAVTIDYGFTNTTALANKWSVSTTNPLGDLANAQAAQNANGYSADIAVYSPDSWNALWNNPQVQNAMKNLSSLTPISSYELGQSLPAGVQRAPSFTYPVLDNFIYSGKYTANNVLTSYIPAGTTLLGSRNVNNRLIYALVTQLEQEDGQFHSYSMDRVPKFEANINKNFYMQTLTARPVPVPVDLLSWTVLTNCA